MSHPSFVACIENQPPFVTLSEGKVAVLGTDGTYYLPDDGEYLHAPVNITIVDEEYDSDHDSDYDCGDTVSVFSDDDSGSDDA